MKKLYALAAALFLGVSAFAQTTYNVTFQVDMGSATINANGVHVAGSFQGWSPGTTAMTQVGTSSIYSTTVSVSAGALEYKFVNGNAWNFEETPGAAIQVGAGNNNRWAVISQDTTLPAVMYGGSAPAGQKAIQLKVDMALQTVSSDSVHVAGSFQGWDPSKSQMVNFKGVHRYIAYMNETDTAYFKFVNGNAWGSDESVPTACQAATLGFGGADRFYTDTLSGIYEVCYAQCGPCVVFPTYDITINVDLNSVVACASIDSVTLAGPINGWGGELMSDPDGDGIYSISYMDVDSGDFQFKARYHLAGVDNWEGGGNKIVTVSSDSVVAPRCFGNDTYGPCATTPPTADVTFIVDFTQASFTPADTIFLMGTFTGWNSDSAIVMVPHSTAGQYIATLSQFCPGTMDYRFSNGDPSDNSNHEPVPADCGVDNGVGSYNRFFARTGSADTVQHIFGACSFISVEENALDAVAIYPNPMTDVATIALGTSDFYTVRVMDITGRLVAGMDNAQGNVALNASEMGRGMYFVNIANSKGELRTMKVIVE
jgi:hypothetical protein